GEAGQSTAIFHLVTHAFFKALLFLTAGSVIHALHHAADPNDMRLMGGLWRRMPITAATCGIGVLALAGFPPFAGFWSKDAIIGLLLHRSGAQLLGVSGQVTPGHGPEPWAAAIGATVAVVVTLLTALYAVRLWLMVFAGAARSHDADSARESSVWMTLPLVVLAVPSVLVGGWLHHGNLLHGYLTAHMAHELEMHLPVAAVATVLGLAGAAAAWSLYGRRPVAAGSGSVPSDPITRMPAPIYALLVNLWYMDRFWTWVGRSFAMAVATLIAWFDRNVVDGAVRGSGRVVAAIGSAMARSTNGQPQTYAAMVLAATVALILLMALYETAAAPAAGATAVRLAEWAVRR
ncbi:MAG: hypothetical protein GX446_13165, partial [Chthonomonadales bacterium]|nr:hypothetical protein [Chthonomonadales bacterium]